MQREINPVAHPIHIHLTVPGSKSITLRALILAALADGVSELSGMQISNDTISLINALHQLGIAIQFDSTHQTAIVAGCNGKLPKKQATLACSDAKLVAYFLLAICAGSPGVYYFDGNAPLRKLMFSKLLNMLCRQGTQFIPNDTKHLPLTLIGADTLEGGEIIFDEPMTSQLIAALLMVAPYMRSSFACSMSEVGKLHHLDMTCMMMAEFGVLVHRIHQNQLLVPVPQRYHAKDYIIEPDFTLAAYFFAAAALTGGQVTIQPTKCAHSKQTDAKLITVLEKMGCHIFETHTGLTVKGPEKLQGVTVNIEDFPTTFSTLMALAPFAATPTCITHLNLLTPIELQRFNALKNELIRMNVALETKQDSIEIFPSTPRGGLVNTHHNYHIASAFAIIGLKIPGIVLDNDVSIAKKHGEFFTWWETFNQQEKVIA